MPDKQLGVNPWTHIWTHPRETIRSIVDFNPKHRFFLLSFLHGLPTLFYFAQDMSMGSTFSLVGIILTSIILATFIGMLSITIGTALIYWTGKWIGGQGTFYPIRAAVSWSNVPNTVIIATWGVLIFLFRNQLFVKGFPQETLGTPNLLLITVLMLLQLTMSIWAIVILVKELAEVQGFSAWKGLLNVIIPIVIIFVAFFIIGFLVTLITMALGG